MDTPTGTGATVSASRLREAREYLGFSQGDVAAAMDRVPGWTDDIENGRRAITGEELCKLSRLYRRPVGWFTGEWEHHPDPDMVRQLNENPRLTDGDREAVLDFAEFLAGAGKPPKLSKDAVRRISEGSDA